MRARLKDTAIGIFAYNRPSHLKRILISLSNHKLENLYVFLDGPKNSVDRNNQDEIKLMINNFPSQIKLIKRKVNLGLKKSITSGVNYLASKHSKFIIIEDDCVPFYNFFNYFYNSFKILENDDESEVICAYQHPKLTKKFKKYYNLKLDMFIPWGWGTLSKNWNNYQNSKYVGNLPGIYKNLIKSKNKNSIWSLNYISYIYNEKKKCIYPSHSMIKNIGFDGSGVNSKNTNLFRVLEKRVKLSTDCVYLSNVANYQKGLFKNKLKFFY